MSDLYVMVFLVVLTLLIQWFYLNLQMTSEPVPAFDLPFIMEEGDYE